MRKFIQILLLIGEIIGFAVVPIVLFVVKCTTITGNAGGTKLLIGGSAYICLFLLFLLFKYCIMKNFLKDLNGRVNNYQSILAVETDKTKARNCEKSMHKDLIIRDVIDLMPIAVIFGFGELIISALEKGTITLSFVTAWATVSVLCGYACRILKHALIKSKVAK